MKEVYARLEGEHGIQTGIENANSDQAVADDANYVQVKEEVENVNIPVPIDLITTNQLISEYETNQVDVLNNSECIKNEIIENDFEQIATPTNTTDNSYDGNNEVNKIEISDSLFESNVTDDVIDNTQSTDEDLAANSNSTSDTDANIFYCKQCQKKYDKKRSYDWHMLRHRKKFQCDQCQKYFSSGNYLTIHMKLHTGLKPYQCDQCQKRFAIKPMLKSHMKTHTQERPYQCDRCEKRFNQKGNFDRHRMKMHIDDPFYCGGCFRGFSQNTEKETHERQCTKSRFACNLCNEDEQKKPFVTFDKILYERHLLIHSGETPFQCNYCEKRYGSRSSLQYHTLTHFEKRYKCNYCTKQFNRKKLFNEHIEKHHHQEKHHLDHHKKSNCVQLKT